MPSPPGGGPAPIAVALGSARSWIGAACSTGRSRAPRALAVAGGGAEGGRLAAAFCAPDVPEVRGALVVVAGAEARAQRAALLHALLGLAGAAKVAFLSDAAAARIAADSPRAIVVDVGAGETRVHYPSSPVAAGVARGGARAVQGDLPHAVWDRVARAMLFASPRDPPPGDVVGDHGVVLLPGAERAARPEVLFADDGASPLFVQQTVASAHVFWERVSGSDRFFFVSRGAMVCSFGFVDECNVGVAILKAMKAAPLLERAEGSEIILCGGGSEIFGFGERLLAEMRKRCADEERFQGLRKMVEVTRIVETPFSAGMLPWIGAVVAASSSARSAEIVVTSAMYESGDFLHLVDDDCCTYR